ncbi:MAG TPA: zf-TFIIB domain-containing protein [Luteimonas sp.]|nr:zf-TFIIB domain-containing protein [Luteimonas sp.]
MRAIALPGGATEYLCMRCEGLWLPGRLVQASIGATALERIRDAGTPRNLRCPNDGHQLQALHHHGIEIDACPHCAGVWLDAGERDRILQARERPRMAQRVADVGAEAGHAIDLVEIAGDIGSAVLEFIGDALSGL